MSAWLKDLVALSEVGTPAVLVTILTTKGSTPREAGCKMVVSAKRIFGTIGGGHLELKAIEIAREMLDAPPIDEMVPLTRDFPLGPGLGQCCGGHASLLFEAVLPCAHHIALFGAGHVGQALVKLLGDLPCRVTWIDSRADMFPESLRGNVCRRISALPAHEIAALPTACDVLVMTHSHQLDLDIIDAALKRPDLRSIGLIGSETKRARFLRRLEQRGLGAAARKRLVCPIGIPGISGKEPAIIAIAVAAQLLQRWSPRSMSQPHDEEIGEMA